MKQLEQLYTAEGQLKTEENVTNYPILKLWLHNLAQWVKHADCLFIYNLLRVAENINSLDKLNTLILILFALLESQKLKQIQH